MNHNGTQLAAVAPLARRTNGLSPVAPDPGRLILVTGGAGYIGSVLAQRLLNRGYRVRILDRLYWGRGPINAILDQVELVEADVRDMPATALDGVDAVINLAGLCNDPTAEFNPEANWQMNAIATETLGRNCLERGIERYVFASSCSLYDGMPPGMHDEDAPIEPRAAYATSKRYGERALLELADEGLCPVMLRNGTVYGWSPRMRFDLVVNTFVKDALLKGQLSLHGGGWMWRPLVDMRDVRGRDDRSYGGAGGEGARRDLQRRALELPDPRARDDGGRLRPAARPFGHARGGPAPRLTRDYECANAKLSTTLGFIPRRSVLEAVDGILAAIDVEDRIDAHRPALLQHPLARAAAAS